MSGIFNVTELAGHRALVTGEGAQQCILDTTERDELFAKIDHMGIDVAFDAEVERFFAPLVDAVQEYDERHRKVADRFNLLNDPAFSVVLKPAVEAVAGEPEQRVVLSHDSVVLRLIDEGQTDRLVWVGNDRIEIIARATPLPEVDDDEFVQMSAEETALFGKMFADLGAAMQGEAGEVDEPTQDELPDAGEDEVLEDDETENPDR